SEGYPPWRYRLRRISQYSITKNNSFLRFFWHRKMVRYLAWTRQWEVLTKETPDQAVIAADSRCCEAYRIVEAFWPKVWDSVLQQMPPEHRAPYDIAERHSIIGDLIDRI